ncbi:hypothetical protein MNBD_GAMMA02-1631 [hydrothermal vent metagenome]|uniref:Uncharacterized protein n=1 Tax=hydrothermal vent metagenome TaxID=652676 RepID=A0A3B0VQQ1_9ZZZZ
MSLKLKYGLFILAVIGLSWLALKWVNQDIQVAKPEVHMAPDSENKNPQTAKPTTQTELNQQQTHNQTQVNNQGLADNWQDDWLDQLANRRYSEDTAVELSSIAMEYESCGNAADMSWRFKDQQLTKAQNQIKTAVEKHCADLISTYPLLNNNQINNGLQLAFNTFPANSQLGKFIQQQANQDSQLKFQDFATGLIPLSIKAKNSQMLIVAEWMFGFRSQYEAFDPALIGSQNTTYLNSLQSIALTALSCQFQNGISCSPTSKFMQNKCFSNEQFCGQTFSQWFDRSVTPGMAKDVELLKQHYLNLAVQ